MSQIPEELSALLARARQDAPEPARLARVRARLESQIGPLDAPRPRASPTLAPKVTLGVVAVLALLAIGAWLARRSASDEALAEPAHAAAGAEIAGGRELPGGPPAAEPIVTEAAEPSASAAGAAEPIAAEAAEPSTAEAAEPSAAAGAPIDAPDGPAARGAATDRVASRGGARRASVAPIGAPAADSESTLREEIALLDRALRAREAGDLARARAALDEHRARFPSGTLSPERDRMAAELAPARGAEPESTTTP